MKHLLPPEISATIFKWSNTPESPQTAPAPRPIDTTHLKQLCEIKDIKLKGSSLHKLYKDIYQRNRGCGIADLKHDSEEIMTSLELNIKGWASSGVKDLFMEVPRDYQKDFDQYLKTGNKKGLSLWVDEFQGVLDQCRKHGVRLHCMDVKEDDMVAHKEVERCEKEFDLAKKLQNVNIRTRLQIQAEFDKKYAKEIQAAEDERITHNKPMAQLVIDTMKDRPNAKYMFVVGGGHTLNMASVAKDMDELIGEGLPGGLVTVALLPSSRTGLDNKLYQPFLMTGESAQDIIRIGTGRNSFRDNPEFLVILPPIEYQKMAQSKPVMDIPNHSERDILIKKAGACWSSIHYDYVGGRECEIFKNTSNDTPEEWIPKKNAARKVLEEVERKLEEMDLEGARKLLNEPGSKKILHNLFEPLKRTYKLEKLDQMLQELQNEYKKAKSVPAAEVEELPKGSNIKPPDNLPPKSEGMKSPSP